MTLPDTIADLHHPERIAALQARIDHKTKPQGSLGELEKLALRSG